MDRSHDATPDPSHLTERERAVRAVVLGLALGAVLGVLARRR